MRSLEEKQKEEESSRESDEITSLKKEIDGIDSKIRLMFKGHVQDMSTRGKTIRSKVLRVHELRESLNPTYTEINNHIQKAAVGRKDLDVHFEALSAITGAMRIYQGQLERTKASSA